MSIVEDIIYVPGGGKYPVGVRKIQVTPPGGTQTTANAEYVVAQADDGAIATIGTTTDTAVTAATGGTLIGLLRALKEAFLARTPALGQATMTASTPVVIASNQSSVPVTAARIKGTPVTTQVTVGTTATLLLGANPNRKSATLTNNDASAPFYLGPTNAVTVSGTNGGETVGASANVYDDDTTSAWYGIVASGTVDVRVVEVA